MRTFFDTSAFAKRYLQEPGSDEVISLIDDTDQLAVSVLCIPEFVSTLSRLVRERKLSAGARAKLKDDALADLVDADLCQITPEVIASTVRLLETYPLRTIDGLQVASAIALRVDAFVSADRRQLSAARAMGLRVVDVS